jgi:hypothetical protein
MPLGSEATGAAVPVPQGRPRIAQRFIAGLTTVRNPKSRRDGRTRPHASFAPSGLGLRYTSSPAITGVLPKYRSAVVLDGSNVRTGLFLRGSPIHSDRSFLLLIDCGFGQHALTRWAIITHPPGTKPFNTGGMGHVASFPVNVPNQRARCLLPP